MDAMIFLISVMAFVGIVVGVVLAVVRYLRAVMRGSLRGASWVRAVPRVAFPLLAGVFCCLVRMGHRRMEQEMGDWFWAITITTVVSATIALAHVVIAAGVRRGDSGDRPIAFGLLALILAPIVLSVTFLNVGDRY